MVYLSPDGNRCVLECSCGSDSPRMTFVYMDWKSDAGKDLGTPDFIVYAGDYTEYGKPTLWNRLRLAWRTLVSGWPCWPTDMLLLGGNESDVEVENMRVLTGFLSRTTDRYERDLAEYWAKVKADRA